MTFNLNKVYDSVLSMMSKPLRSALSVSVFAVEERQFGAAIGTNGRGIVLEVSTGLMAIVFNFWQSTSCLSASNIDMDGSENRNAEYALVWLILHELHHLELGHFAFADRFGVSQRVFFPSNEVRCLPEYAYPDLRQCLEMQADHGATEVFLGAYSSRTSQELRRKVMAISAMMVLIEREEAKLNLEDKTHPKAATRIFQLLCHVAELPLISSHLERDPSLLPSQDELERFGKEVTLPCYFDAVQLAEVAGAERIQADLGSPEDFFADMAIVKLANRSRFTELKTEGAKEWAQLWGCNDALKPLQKGVHFAI